MAAPVFVVRSSVGHLALFGRCCRHSSGFFMQPCRGIVNHRIVPMAGKTGTTNTISPESRRTLFGFGADESHPRVLSKTYQTDGNVTHFTEKAISQYSQEQLFELVSNVSEYKHFVPFCTDSKIVFKNDKLMLAKLTVGYGAITESYTSKITLQKPSIVTAVSSDSSLFKTLHNTWEFAPTPTGCQITFKITFEFSSVLYSRIVGTLFREISQTTLAAFDKRCWTVFGPPPPKRA